VLIETKCDYDNGASVIVARWILDAIFSSLELLNDPGGRTISKALAAH